jgi:ABC-type multidrug transport system ATPase subunit
MIRLEGLTKAYGGQSVLRNVSLQVRPGEVLALVGPNGAGKSTTLRIVAGIIRADSGRATLDGFPAAHPDARRSLGYLPQKPGVPGNTSLESLARLVAELRGLPGSAGADILTSIGLADRRHAALAELSGGQRQRLMLALATLGPVTSLLLDEPGISLDADGAEDVQARIREARARGTAVLFASHHLADVAALADRVVIMVGGSVVAQGTVAELARRAAIPWNASGAPPIETIYRTLVSGNRARVREVA